MKRWPAPCTRLTLNSVLNNMTMQIPKLAFQKLSDTVIGYYQLWSYLDARGKHFLANRATHNPKSCLDFYCGLRDNRIKNGDRVLLREFFITDWIPRAAGGIAQFAANEGLSATQYESLATLYNPTTHEIHPGYLLPPYGSVRFGLEHGRRILLGAVTAGEYNTDFGVVLSVSNSVYSEFLSKQQGNCAVEGDIEGYLDVFCSCEASPKPPVPTTTMSMEVDQFGSTLSSLSAPTYVLRIDSPLQVKFRTHDTHPRLNAWFLRRERYKERRWTGINMRRLPNGKVELDRIYSGLIEFHYLHCPVLENDPDAFFEVRKLVQDNPTGIGLSGIVPKNTADGVNLMRNYGNVHCEHPTPSAEIRRQLEQHLPRDFVREPTERDRLLLGVDQLTEFDARQALVEPLIPFRVDPRTQEQCGQIVEQIVAFDKEIEKPTNKPNSADAKSRAAD